MLSSSTVDTFQYYIFFIVQLGLFMYLTYVAYVVTINPKYFWLITSVQHWELKRSLANKNINCHLRYYKIVLYSTNIIRIFIAEMCAKNVLILRNPEQHYYK